MSRLDHRLKKLEGPPKSGALVTVLTPRGRPAEDEQTYRKMAEMHYGRSDFEMMVLESSAENGLEFSFIEDFTALLDEVAKCGRRIGDGRPSPLAGLPRCYEPLSPN